MERKQEIIEAFCQVSAKVGAHLESQFASDCFCHKSDRDPVFFQFEEPILDFIWAAVNEKIARESRAEV